MSVVFILVFVAIAMAGGFLVAFIWSVKNGQYDDTYTPSVRILFDDQPSAENKQPASSEKSEMNTDGLNDEQMMNTEGKTEQTGTLEPENNHTKY